jgi:prepilin-type N-terminal cleavage/methylation domain-containing protein
MQIPAARRLDRAGFTLVELLIVVSIIALLAAVSMALYRNARVRGDEAGAVASLRAINDAQFAYAQSCGNQHYAPTLVSLGKPMPTSGQAFLSLDLAATDPVVHQGYQIALGGTALTDGTQSCTGEPPVSAYQVTADPVTPGLSGIRYFATNADRALFEDTVTFVGTMPETGAPPHGSEIK